MSEEEKKVVEVDVKILMEKEFKTKRADGHSLRTVYFMTENGTITINTYILSPELNLGYREIRKFKNLIYQVRGTAFKLDSFMTITKDVLEHIHLLEPTKIIRKDDVLYPLNDKTHYVIKTPNPDEEQK